MCVSACIFGVCVPWWLWFGSNDYCHCSHGGGRRTGNGPAASVSDAARSVSVFVCSV